MNVGYYALYDDTKGKQKRFLTLFGQEMHEKCLLLCVSAVSICRRQYGETNNVCYCRGANERHKLVFDLRHVTFLNVNKSSP